MGTFLNAVKNLINSLTAKTSSTASTADIVQLHDANGNPNGKISLADLASVLGGVYTELVAGTNVDDIRGPGVYYSGSTTRTSSLEGSIPVSVGFSLIVITQNGSTNRAKQILNPATTTNTPAEYQRIYTGGGWSPWFKIAMTEV